MVIPYLLNLVDNTTRQIPNNFVNKEGILGAVRCKRTIINNNDKYPIVTCSSVKRVYDLFS